MKQQDKNSHASLDQAVAAVRAEQPENEAVRAAGERVWQRLSENAQSAAGSMALNSIRGCDDVRKILSRYRSGQLSGAQALLVESHLHECIACRHEAETGKRSTTVVPWQHELPRATNPGFRWVLAAAAMVVIAVGGYFLQDKLFSRAGMRARVESMGGQLFRVGFSGEQPLKVGDELGEGEKIRTGGGSRAMIRLRDGSLVEMNERAEFAVSMGVRDTTIQLGRGNIIVQAAKRKSGHLYVAAKDCRVAVTGTVFSVHSGVKGSRVSVIEGEVRVAALGANSVLHPGQQLSTNAAVATVPVQQEIAWSQNLDKHLALLVAFQHLENRLETVQMPGLRYESKILPLLPANTVLFASIPNLGDAAQQANLLFQQELQESPVLRDWWQQVQARKHGPDLQEILNEVHALGGYLGDEIVFAASLGGVRHGGPLVIAQVRKAGLKEFIAQEYPNQARLRVVDDQELKELSAQPDKELVILVRPDFVVASGDVATLQSFEAALDAGNGGFAGSPFGQRMAAAYQSGVGILFGANLQEMTRNQVTDRPYRHHSQEVFQSSGFSDLQYLVAERKEVNGQMLNHADLTFNGPRRGVASWLAAPAAIGGLDFVSKDAGAAAAFVTKSPAAILDDALNIAYTSDPKAETNITRGESELHIRFREDLAETLGGEVTFALDGPILPTPSWKVVVEVNNSGRLQSTIQQLVADANEHNADHPERHVSMEQESVNGLTYYVLRFQDSGKNAEVDYTFTDGYLILAPSRALVMNAIGIHQSGNSLARSNDFHSLLPNDQHADVSAVVYQNLAPLVGPVLQQLPASQARSFQQLAAETKPSVVCAYGDANAVRVASNSRFFGLDLNTLAISTLLKMAQPGSYRVD